ncbi:MAG TPA: hypothetical protein VEY31_05095, partial [Roseococcus sp.]|nr:hypothetical protein [Roseococcus sp.]
MMVRGAAALGVLVAALCLLPGSGLSQGGSGPLAPPSLPATLPGGGAMPALPPGAQQDILQRLLDAGAGRQPGGGPPAAPPQPSPPQPAALPAWSGPGPAGPALQAAPEESLSPVEAFFAPRLTT